MGRRAHTTGRGSEPGSGMVQFLAETARVLQRVDPGPLEQAIDLLLAARRDGRRVYIIGNGGSAATASHLACDLTKTTYVSDRQALRAFALVDSAPLTTAWANDAAYERVFAEQLTALLDSGDVVIAITASGNSPNIIAGLSVAAASGARTIGVVGFDGGAASSLADIVIHVESFDYGVVEAVHLAIGQGLVAQIRRAIEAELLTDRSAARNGQVAR